MPPTEPKPTPPHVKHSIRIFAIAAVLLSTVATVAYAGSEPTLPVEYRGQWCPAESTADYYFRPTSPADCTDVEKIIVGSTGVGFHQDSDAAKAFGDSCTLRAVTTTPPKWRGQVEPAVVWLRKLYEFHCRSTTAPNNRPTRFYSALDMYRGAYLHMEKVID